MICFSVLFIGQQALVLIYFIFSKLTAFFQERKTQCFIPNNGAQQSPGCLIVSGACILQIYGNDWEFSHILLTKRRFLCNFQSLKQSAVTVITKKVF